MSSDDDRESQISDMDMGPEPVSKRQKLSGDLMLVHFKVSGLPEWDYTSVALSFFGGEKYIVQYEKLASNPHVHFQGYTCLGQDAINKRITDLAATHYSKALTPNSRPIRMVRREVDLKGFQYLMKEGHAPLAQSGFTPEALQELKEASDAHVRALKCSLIDFLIGIPLTPECLKNAKTLVAYCVGVSRREYYTQTEKRYNQRVWKGDWICAMMKREDLPEDLKDACMLL